MIETFGEATKFLNIQKYEDRIMNSSSTGELFFIVDYINLANHWKRNNFNVVEFSKLIDDIVKHAEDTWKRPESVFQHMPKMIFGK